jgi:hypothetical protein
MRLNNRWIVSAVIAGSALLAAGCSIPKAYTDRLRLHDGEWWLEESDANNYLQPGRIVIHTEDGNGESTVTSSSGQIRMITCGRQTSGQDDLPTRTLRHTCQPDAPLACISHANGLPEKRFHLSGVVRFGGPDEEQALCVVLRFASERTVNDGITIETFSDQTSSEDSWDIDPGSGGGSGAVPGTPKPLSVDRPIQIDRVARPLPKSPTK